MHCACAKRPYFHCQSKIWRHHRVSRPQFSFRRDNFGDSATNKGYIAYFSLRMRDMALFPLTVKNLTSPSCSSPRFPKRQENFGDSATNEGYCKFFIAHARNGRISTSGLESDVTIVFLDPDFLNGAKISAIRPQIRLTLRIFHCACAKWPYFYFRSKIWRHHRVPWPRFPRL